MKQKSVVAEIQLLSLVFEATHVRLHWKDTNSDAWDPAATNQSPPNNRFAPLADSLPIRKRRHGHGTLTIGMSGAFRWSRRILKIRPSALIKRQ